MRHYFLVDEDDTYEEVLQAAIKAFNNNYPNKKMTVYPPYNCMYIEQNGEVFTIGPAEE